MPTRHRPTSSTVRPRTTSAGTLALCALLALAGCSSGASEPTAVDATPATQDAVGLATGIPDTWAAGIDDGMERYPNLGSMGMGDMQWVCPLVDTVAVDGEDRQERGTTFWKLADGVYELECGFREDGVSATLRYAEAEDDAAFAGLVGATDAFDQRGNEQVQDATTIGERDYVLVTWTYPTNESAGAKYVACYLDDESLARACLELNESEKDGDEYSGEQAAEILAGLLAG